MSEGWGGGAGHCAEGSPREGFWACMWGGPWAETRLHKLVDGGQLLPSGRMWCRGLAACSCSWQGQCTSAPPSAFRVGGEQAPKVGSGTLPTPQPVPLCPSQPFPQSSCTSDPFHVRPCTDGPVAGGGSRHRREQGDREHTCVDRSAREASTSASWGPRHKDLGAEWPGPGLEAGGQVGEDAQREAGLEPRVCRQGS